MSLVYEILYNHGVEKTETLDFKSIARKRIDYLKKYLVQSNKHALVLGISGGVDSSTAGKMCQITCSELRSEGYYANFVAVRLPSHSQKDEQDATMALKFIDPDFIETIDIGPSVDRIHMQMPLNLGTNVSNDFHKGNVKARMRMLAQYELAGIYNGLVVGTDHNSELVPAFYTKWGDQACDITVLNGLNKRQVRLLGKHLGMPEKLHKKPATADLEELDVGKLDEVALGFSYDDLDDFLEGKSVSEEVVVKICEKYEATRHKRNWPVAYEE